MISSKPARATHDALVAPEGLCEQADVDRIAPAYPVPAERLRAVLAEVNLTRHNEDDVRRFEQAVAAAPQIVSCYATTGQADYVIKVLMPDIKSYERFLHETVFKLPGVTHVRSSVVLKEVKAEMRLPIEAPGKPARAKARRA